MACAALLAPTVAGSEERPRLAILPIVIYSQAEDAYLQRGLGDMLASRIGRDPQLVVLPVLDAQAATTEDEVARATGRDLGADYVLYGSFTRFGEGASLDLNCTSVLDQGVGSREVFVQSGTLADLIPKLDPLAEKVARYVTGTTPVATAPSAASRNGSAPGGLDELLARVEALEQAVFAPEPEETVEGGFLTAEPESPSPPSATEAEAAAPERSAPEGETP